METYNFEHTKEAFERYGLLYVAKAAKILEDTKKLKHSLKPIVTEMGDNEIKLSISMPKYAEFVDSGRKPGSKFPPEKPIEDWIKQSGIKQFRVQKNWKTAGNKGGRFISNKSRLFLIRRAIARDGIKPRPFIDMFFTDINKFLSDLGPAVAMDVAYSLQVSFNDADIGNE